MWDSNHYLKLFQVTFCVDLDAFRIGANDMLELTLATPQKQLKKFSGMLQSNF